jgi:hypothetical protein
VVASDGPGEYPVIGESRAGYMDDMQLTPGHIAYITTGTPTPLPSSLDDTDTAFCFPLLARVHHDHQIKGVQGRCLRST